MFSSTLATLLLFILLLMQCASQRQFFNMFRPPRPQAKDFPPNDLFFPTDVPMRQPFPTTATTRFQNTRPTTTRTTRFQNTRPTTTEYPTTRRTTTMTPCEKQCQVTQEFNPVCANDGENYSNPGRLKCAQNCGKRVTLNHYGQCRSARTTQAPLPRFFNKK